MNHFYQIPGLIAMILLVLVGCQSVPTDSGGPASVTDDVYVNDEWGFQVARPDSSWGLSAQVSYQVQEANGLPAVEVWMYGSLIDDGVVFQPLWYLKPQALLIGETSENALAGLEGERGLIFSGYTAGEKKLSTVGNMEVVEWLFEVPVSSRQNFMFGTEFWVAVLFRNQQGYVMLGSGIPGIFPLATYRAIVSNLVFLN